MKLFLQKLFFYTITFMFCAQFSSQNTSTSSKEKPAINVSGILIDNTDKSYTVENITISGRYSDIPVYRKPITDDINPDINTTRLDLREIHEIRLVSQEILKINNRDYVEIEIISKDAHKTANTYIIERTKRIYCDEINQAGPIEKELSFLAIKSLTIKGFCSREEGLCQNRKYSNSDNYMVTDMIVTKTKAIIDQIEDATKEISKDDPKEAALQTRLINLLNELKSTLKSWFA